MNIDETMSDEIAFGEDGLKEELFTFDEPDHKKLETSDEKEPASSSSEEKTDVVDESSQEEQKVPYSRFKKKVDELHETSSKINFLEERLADLENQRTESRTSEDVEPDAEWIKLYGDSDIAKEAYKTQLKRENAIAERAVSQALDMLKRQQVDEANSIADNEDIIDDNLANLQEAIGVKLNSRQEEAVLSIVDEFSPLDENGKYVTLFPFEKAYEIYELRNSKRTQATRSQRQSVASLSGSDSDGEADVSSPGPLKAGWDSWREGL